MPKMINLLNVLLPAGDLDLDLLIKLLVIFPIYDWDFPNIDHTSWLTLQAEVYFLFRDSVLGSEGLF